MGPAYPILTDIDCMTSGRVAKNRIPNRTVKLDSTALIKDGEKAFPHDF
jgi:hypothetical protein